MTSQINNSQFSRIPDTLNIFFPSFSYSNASRFVSGPLNLIIRSEKIVLSIYLLLGRNYIDFRSGFYSHKIKSSSRCYNTVMSLFLPISICKCFLYDSGIVSSSPIMNIWYGEFKIALNPSSWKVILVRSQKVSSLSLTSIWINMSLSVCMKLPLMIWLSEVC